MAVSCPFRQYFSHTKLQIRVGTEDNLMINFLFLNKNICCDPSLEPSRRDGSNDGLQRMF